MTQRKIKISLLFIFYLIFYFKLYSQDYYSINNFGKLKFYNDSLFSFHYWDCGIDSGIYKIKEDTIFLKSRILPIIKLSNINKYQNGSYYFNFVSSVEIFDAQNCFQKKIISNIDTAKNTVRITNVEFKKGQILNFSIFGMPRKLIWNNDTIYSCYFEIDQRYGKRVYFKNYPLLMRDNYLLPFDEEANENFRKINGFEFLPMKKGKKNQKYKVYLSGFGEVH